MVTGADTGKGLDCSEDVPGE